MARSTGSRMRRRFWRRCARAGRSRRLRSTRERPDVDRQVAIRRSGRGDLIDAAAMVLFLLANGVGLTAFAMLAIPEPGMRRAGALASLRPRVGVPRQARAMFAIALPSLVALWA